MIRFGLFQEAKMPNIIRFHLLKYDDLYDIFDFLAVYMIVNLI